MKEFPPCPVAAGRVRSLAPFDDRLHPNRPLSHLPGRPISPAHKSFAPSRRQLTSRPPYSFFGRHTFGCEFNDGLSSKVKQPICIIERSQSVHGGKLHLVPLSRTARANALACSKACSLVTISGRKAPGKDVVPKEISGWPAVRKPNLEAAAHRHSLVFHDADMVRHRVQTAARSNQGFDCYCSFLIWPKLSTITKTSLPFLTL